MRIAWRKLFLCISLLSVLELPIDASALELTFYGGYLTHTNVSGCCASSGTKQGFGVLGRLPLGRLGLIELGGYSDSRWNEAYVLKPFYILGGEPAEDPLSSSLMTVRSVPDWRWIFSAGVGYFTHTARTQDFDLPILLNGITVTTFNHVIYSLDDRWSVGGLLEAGCGISTSDMSLIFGTYLTLDYYF
ncbi:MAG: hypothetical protein HC902_06640 [Calothrix sp. SM1_5_4]|nr:hypothetical protein [Calothrix sp. SM1_5_4]